MHEMAGAITLREYPAQLGCCAAMSDVFENRFTASYETFLPTTRIFKRIYLFFIAVFMELAYQVGKEKGLLFNLKKDGGNRL